MLRERRKCEDRALCLPSELAGETTADMSGSRVRDISIDVLLFCERITPTLLSGLVYFSHDKELGNNNFEVVVLFSSIDSELEVLGYLVRMIMFTLYLFVKLVT